MKSPFITYRSNRLFIEDAAAEKLAERFGTPLYVYSRGAVEAAFHSYQYAFSRLTHLVCYSLKANSNLAVAATLARNGCGADIVSGGELRRALLAGFDPHHIIFSGVGKTKD
ncbi:MAG: diaminopimelate decarboxylase, partial [Elusimicrobia bacterium]|nr:diaminopimelate decarboxylase [Elusimicrobiota bacterium]